MWSVTMGILANSNLTLRNRFAENTNRIEIAQFFFHIEPFHVLLVMNSSFRICDSSAAGYFCLHFELYFSTRKKLNAERTIDLLINSARCWQTNSFFFFLEGGLKGILTFYGDIFESKRNHMELYIS